MPDINNKLTSNRPEGLHGEGLLSLWHVHLEGDWTQEERERILNIFRRLSEGSGGISIPKLFNHQAILLHQSGQPGRVGRTRGADIYLDEEWTDWTLAHELGHRWNNAWKRQPERQLRETMFAGKLDWLKRALRQLEKWLENLLRSLGCKSQLNWHVLWYHPGNAPPPCGVDRNFNASEDLAETFAAIILPEKAEQRARRISERLEGLGEKWNWPLQFPHFSATPRGRFMVHSLKTLSTPKNDLQKTE